MVCIQKAAKRKKIHAFKSKMRVEQLEVAQNKRQNAWQQFQTTKGKAKKVGNFVAPPLAYGIIIIISVYLIPQIFIYLF